MFSIRDIGLWNIGRAVPLKLRLNLLGSGRTRFHSTFVGKQFPRSATLSGSRQTQSMAAARNNQEPEESKVVFHSENFSRSLPETFVPSVNEAWHVNITGENWLQGQRNKDWFTGKLPGQCPGVCEDGTLRSLPLPDLSKVTRKATQEYFDNTWTLYETLFSGLDGEVPFYCPPQHGLRHPQIFYYGHTACFYVNKLQVAGVLNEPVDAYIESVCEVGVDEMLWDDMHKFADIWPTVEQIYEYRKKVYKLVSDVIATHPDLEDNGGKNPVAITENCALYALFMGFEHDRIHLETSSVLFREMPRNHVQTPSGWPASFEQPSPDTNPAPGVHYPVNEMLPVEGGQVTLGKPKETPSFGWDNEYGTRELDVPSFSASKFMVTNGEFFQFVKAGGYTNEHYWSAPGWEWRKFRNAKWPFFWEQNGPQGSLRFKLRNIFDTVDMAWGAPVDVTLYEAKAYCAWKSEQDGLLGKPEAYRVTTEAEHHLLRPAATKIDAVRANHLSDRIMSTSGAKFAVKDGANNANLNLAWGSQIPVDSLLPSETGHHDTMGNSWEWTEDHFNPLEGWQFHPYYDDFSAPCFDGRHNMIMGGSFMSTGLMAGTFARFHFRPHFLQHSGFRLVSSSEKAPATHLDTDEANKNSTAGGTPVNVYETDELVDQYLGFHFARESGKSEKIPSLLPHANQPDHAQRFPQRVAELLVALKPAKTNGRALDVGCAVGGSSFELATQFDQVVGFDFSSAFVNAAKQMQEAGEMKFQLSMEAGISETVFAVHESHVDQTARSKITFQTGDACHMEEIDGTFDGAVVANLLCRVPEPLRVLDGLAAKINPGGIVVLSTPFSWLEQYTNQSQWLGGYRNDAGEAVYSKGKLRQEMEARGFQKVHEEQMPCLIREHQRKYQYIISEATAWRKM